MPNIHPRIGVVLADIKVIDDALGDMESMFNS